MQALKQRQWGNIIHWFSQCGFLSLLSYTTQYQLLRRSMTLNVLCSPTNTNQDNAWRVCLGIIWWKNFYQLSFLFLGIFIFSCCVVDMKTNQNPAPPPHTNTYTHTFTFCHAIKKQTNILVNQYWESVYTNTSLFHFSSATWSTEFQDREGCIVRLVFRYSETGKKWY